MFKLLSSLQPLTSNEKDVALEEVRLLGLVPFVPNWLVLGFYGYLGFRFFAGFDSTTYNKNSRVILTLLWPIMFLANERFRDNFKKALRQGSDDN
eukprot:jgi/Galph1/3181/GphlegSOOS_G1846.1